MGSVGPPRSAAAIRLLPVATVLGPPPAPHALVDERDRRRPVDRDLTGEPRVAEPLGEPVVPVVGRRSLSDTDAAGGAEPPSAAVEPAGRRRVRRQPGVEQGPPEVTAALHVEFDPLVSVDDDEGDRLGVAVRSVIAVASTAAVAVAHRLFFARRTQSLPDPTER